MDRKMKLETPSEQSRLLSDIPKVIPEMVVTKSSPEGSPRKDDNDQNDLLEFAIGETHNPIELHSRQNGFASPLNDGRILDVTLSASETIKEKQGDSVANATKAGMNDKQGTSTLATPTTKPKVIIELSDDDEGDANIADITARKVVENPEVPVWHCMGPQGERAGPYSMSILKCWSPATSVEFKVWKAGQREEEAISLTDALRKHFPTI
ncbi:hypothetical protein PIB30_067586 [Stylosanthes scabra]|uniref:Uncharacterized protein n=1 Tax=Stylosanthes scabra TaxID=79078 RepID=A0ABU6SMP9_9FABA|nr:hypothetical protein [Stylosanthes scabra]